MNVVFGMASQVLKEGWKKRLFLRGVKCSHLSTSVIDQRSSLPYTSMLRLPLCSEFGILCSYLLYYEEGTWTGAEQNKFYMKLLKLF